MGQTEEKISILLVDDRPENLISLAAILENPGYRLVTAESGRDALKKLLDEEFALILLDVQMPVMDGFETASLIKKRDKSKHIPIIFVTALSLDAPFLFKGYSAGAVDYIVKPFDPTIMRSKVAVFADLYRKTRQLERQSAIMRANERLEHEREITRIELIGLRREQKANEKYKDLVEGISDGIVWTADLHSLHFSFLSAQSQAILGNSNLFSAALRQNMALQNHRNALVEMLRSGAPPERDFRFEHQITKPDGTGLWFRSGVRLAKCQDSGAYELRGLSVDITKLKKAQEEAHDAIRVRDQFLSIASHELKTPLTPLCLQLEILQRLTKSGAPAELIGQKLTLYMDRLYRQTDRLSHLIDELLDVSRINNGKLMLEKTEASLSDIVREVCDRFGQELARSGSELKLDLESDIHGCWDRLRMEQVVTNLLTNAIKYGEGRPIEISVRRVGDHAEFRIRDNGIGVSREDQQRIFKLYERAVSPMHFGGLGLGLYIVRQILEAHGGRIQVESQPGKGSEFTVNIPLRDGVPQEAELHEAQMASS